MLDAVEIEREENRLRDAVSALPDAARKRYYERLRDRTKDPDTYATLNWFLVAGLHHFYLGKMARGVVNLTVFAVGVLLLFILPPIGFAIIAAIFVVELWALFRSQVIVRDHNNRVSAATLREVSDN
jgi:TM2 domain-containing membrane protein YozV